MSSVYEGGEGRRRTKGLYGEAIRSTAESMDRLDKDPVRHEQARQTRAEDRSKRRNRTNALVQAIREKAEKKRKRGGGSSRSSVAKPRALDPGIDEARQYVLRPTEIIPVVVPKPRSNAIYDIVPEVTEYPTATLVGTAGVGNDGAGVPWSTAPQGLAIPFIASIVGQIIITVGTQFVASLATTTISKLGGDVGYSIAHPGVNIRVHTGRGAGRGAYQRLRGKGGEKPDDDADPYDQPAEWWEFWKWSF